MLLQQYKCQLSCPTPQEHVQFIFASVTDNKLTNQWLINCCILLPAPNLLFIPAFCFPTTTIQKQKQCLVSLVYSIYKSLSTVSNHNFPSPTARNAS